ncbi:hypothetical protein JK361_35120 [Streptomyces sp. 5-8]|uniref:Transporter n=1 Tax=Streptomyces musisoli TaxID=2802280 RepID=A0ABS1PC51_9ACTN|nr:MULTISPECIES: hypothetical protein [Streptomyces]MBL1109749.1 hypothetical protein [Streptomyces musisoli]MBY8847108.1 hypothetical protein [Streptomyces sp. SP2-10]
MDQNSEASVSDFGAQSRFGMAQALVVLGFLTAAVVLCLLTSMTVHAILALLAVSGLTAVAVLFLFTACLRNGGTGRRLLRLLNALASGSGS